MRLEFLKILGSNNNKEAELQESFLRWLLKKVFNHIDIYFLEECGYFETRVGPKSSSDCAAGIMSLCSLCFYDAEAETVKIQFRRRGGESVAMFHLLPTCIRTEMGWPYTRVVNVCLSTVKFNCGSAETLLNATKADDQRAMSWFSHENFGKLRKAALRSRREHVWCTKL